jgi:hypothetical protein
MDYLGKTPKQAVTYAGLKIAESGRHIMRAAKAARGTKREVIENPEWASAVAGIKRLKAIQNPTMQDKVRALRRKFQDRKELAFPYFIVFPQQRGAPFHMGTIDKNDPRRKIWKIGEHDSAGRPGKGGLGWNVWHHISGKMGAGAGTGSVGGVDKQAFVSLKEIEHMVSLRIINKLSYQEKAYPGITAAAMRHGSEGLEHMVNLKVQAALRRSGLAA